MFRSTASSAGSQVDRMTDALSPKSFIFTFERRSKRINSCGFAQPGLERRGTSRNDIDFEKD